MFERGTEAELAMLADALEAVSPDTGEARGLRDDLLAEVRLEQIAPSLPTPEMTTIAWHHVKAEWQYWSWSQHDWASLNAEMAWNRDDEPAACLEAQAAFGLPVRVVSVLR